MTLYNYERRLRDRAAFRRLLCQGVLGLTWNGTALGTGTAAASQTGSQSGPTPTTPPGEGWLLWLHQRVGFSHQFIQYLTHHEHEQFLPDRQYYATLLKRLVQGYLHFTY